MKGKEEVDTAIELQKFSNDSEGYVKDGYLHIVGRNYDSEGNYTLGKNEDGSYRIAYKVKLPCVLVKKQNIVLDDDNLTERPIGSVLFGNEYRFVNTSEIVDYLNESYDACEYIDFEGFIRYVNHK